MRLIFIGASGHGIVCAEIAELNGYDDILFLDDNRSIKECGKHAVVGMEADFEKFVDGSTAFFVSIGNGHTRRRIQERISDAGGRIATLTHPGSVVSKEVIIGDGTVIMAGATVSNNLSICDGVVIGAGGIVVKSMEEKGTYVGVPAKMRNKIKTGGVLRKNSIHVAAFCELLVA